MTSSMWKRLLCRRYPSYSNKVSVLTNGYPKNDSRGRCRRAATEPTVCCSCMQGGFPAPILGVPLQRCSSLCFTGSRSLIHGTVVLAGALSERESSEVRAFAERLREYGWAICCKGWLARDEVLRLLMEADGLLLSTVTRAQIPGKLSNISRLVAPLCWSQIKTVPPGSSVKGSRRRSLWSTWTRGAGQCDASSTHVLVETAQS